MSARPVRAAGSPPRAGNEEAAELPGAAVGPVGVAPRRVNWKSRWRVSFQVSIKSAAQLASQRSSSHA